jgi:hypothetical protein
VREAILNAVSHRNYQLSGSTFIRQFPRRLEIDSPGRIHSSSATIFAEAVVLRRAQTHDVVMG